MKITLVGFMGSGKSTVGRELSELLGFPLLDLDRLIVEKTGKSIPEIFKSLGEEGFREIEASVLKESLLKEGSGIIATGGGAPAYGENIEVINRHSLSVFLKTPFEVIWERISRDENRPLVKLGREGVMELYRKRLPYYERAKLIVECEGKSPREIAQEIISNLSLNEGEGRASPEGQGGQT